MIYYHNAREAIRNASHDSKECFVGYAKSKGWHRYDPFLGCPEGSVPEFVCAPGRLPIPLSTTAAEVLSCLLFETAQRFKS